MGGTYYPKVFYEQKTKWNKSSVYFALYLSVTLREWRCWKKGPAAPHFLVDLLLSKSAVGREEWGNWKSLPFVQRVFLWEIFYQLCRRFYTTFRAFTALKSSCSLSLLHSFQFTFLNEPRYWLYVQEQDFLTTTYISHTIHNLVVLLLAMAVATKTFCSKTRGEEAFLCSRIWVMNREKVRWNTLVSELKKGRLFFTIFALQKKDFYCRTVTVSFL